MQVFPRYADRLLRGAIGLAVLASVGGPALLYVWVRSPAVTHVGEVQKQPVGFDHEHHVRGLGLACLYCHDGARRDRWAGVPDGSTCLGCHDALRSDITELKAMRTTLEWNRVSDLPDHVFFHHAVHTQRGVACEECHGDVARMQRVSTTEDMTMGWCLDCHRARGASTSCTACHR